MAKYLVIVESPAKVKTIKKMCIRDRWIAEARKYYITIVGKYGNPVQALLKKASGLDIQILIRE